MDQSLLDRQIALEEQMVSLGVIAYRAEVAKANKVKDGSNLAPQTILLRKYIGTMTEKVETFVKESLENKRGRHAVAATYLNRLEPDMSAFIALKTIIGATLNGLMLQALARNVGSRIEEEVRLREFAAKNPVYFRIVKDRIKTTHARHKRAAMNNAFGKSGVEWQDWPEADCIHIGMKMIELVVDLGLVEIVERKTRKNDTRLYVGATAELCEWIETMHDRCELLVPTCLPFLIPPKDWTSPFTGTYHSGALRPLTLVKTRNQNYLRELAERVDDMQPVYNTVNAMQRTPWKINQGVLNVAKEAWDRGLTICKLPSREDLPVVACPLPRELNKDDMTEGQREVLRNWKREATKIHDENARLRSKRVQAARIIHTAMQFENEEAIYFNYQLDFRSRVYAVPVFLNPQGSDLSKAMLTFARGMPINDDLAAGWLAVHGANCYGNDKVSLDERVDWVTENSDRICATANDPFADLWWTDADSPWCFLAFCLEWAALQAHGYGYVSHLPVAMDATCSGIQHFSAMLRDEVGGAAVNLTANTERQDIYQRVADRVAEKLRHDISTGETEAEKEARREAIENGKIVPVSECELARMWFEFEGGKIGRGVTKRTVMVLPYGGTLFSAREFVQDYLREKVYEDGRPNVFGEEASFAAAIYMAKHIWSSIGDVVVGARSVMDWLQKAARVLSKDARPISWTTPAGFPVLQSYFEQSSNRIKTKFGDSLVYLSLSNPTKKLNSRAQANGISPNFVHANDATHLFLTVDLAIDNGVQDFAMIHDSFGTHAANTNMFAACIREAFVDMYEQHDVLTNFHTEVSRMLDDPSKLDPIPTKGSLDIHEVLKSDFFFS